MQIKLLFDKYPDKKQHLYKHLLKKKIMWHQVDNQLYKAFEFKDFPEAFAFMTRVALLAEQHNHHPTWKNTWNKVEIWLSTHDAGDKVTEKDRKLAAGIDGITG